MLRPRDPLAGKTFCKHPASTPVAHNLLSACTLGRSLVLEKSRLASPTARMLNGRPEESSTIGARKKPRMNDLNPPADFHSFGAENTPLKTKRCRWSNSELDRSARKLVLSCGFSSVCKSDESSIECDQV